MSAGSVSGFADCVIWHAPDSTGFFSIICKVRDGHGGEDSSQVEIEVEIRIPSNGQVAWWPFNGDADDESGNGYNGIVNGATWDSTAGRYEIESLCLGTGAFLPFRGFMYRSCLEPCRYKKQPSCTNSRINLLRFKRSTPLQFGSGSQEKSLEVRLQS